MPLFLTAGLAIPSELLEMGIGGKLAADKFIAINTSQHTGQKTEESAVPFSNLEFSLHWNWLHLSQRNQGTKGVDRRCELNTVSPLSPRVMISYPHS